MLDRHALLDCAYHTTTRQMREGVRMPPPRPLGIDLGTLRRKSKGLAGHHFERHHPLPTRNFNIALCKNERIPPTDCGINSLR
jgi:hypothetical protein